MSGGNIVYEIVHSVRWTSILGLPIINPHLSNDEIIIDWVMEIGYIIGTITNIKEKIIFIDSILSRLSCIEMLRILDNVDDKTLTLFSSSRLDLVRGCLKRKRDRLVAQWCPVFT